jgi:hypothetical protein
MPLISKKIKPFKPELIESLLGSIKTDDKPVTLSNSRSAPSLSPKTTSPKTLR